MKCSACGNENKPESTFCAKCLERLNPRRQAAGGRKIVSMPPQSDHLVNISYQSANKDEASASWLWILLAFVAAIAILGLLYA